MKLLYLFIALLISVSSFSFADSIRLTPTLNTKLDDDNSLVYCPTFLVAWDKLGEIVGKPIQLKNESSLAKVLNTEILPENVFPPDSYVAMAGPVCSETVDKLRKALKKKFGNNAPQLPPFITNKMSVIMVYCHFQRLLLFPQKFIRSKKQPLKFMTSNSEHEVQFFGATRNTAERYSSQVDILNYKDKDEFTLRIKSQRKGEFIVLSKMTKPKTLADGIMVVKNQIENKRPCLNKVTNNNKIVYYRNTLGEGDILAVPVIDFVVVTNYFELCDRKFINQGFTNLWIGRAYQNVKFKLDEAGAYVESTAEVDMFGDPKMFKPRRFIFNKPFLVTLWKENTSQPYLALWISSDNALLPFKKKQ